MFLDDPEHASPYSPASRLLLNVLNIDVTAVLGFHESAAAKALVESASFRARLAACRSATHVRYAEVRALKLEVLRLIYAGPQFRDRIAGISRVHRRARKRVAARLSFPGATRSLRRHRCRLAWPAIVAGGISGSELRRGSILRSRACRCVALSVLAPMDRGRTACRRRCGSFRCGHADRSVSRSRCRVGPERR